MGICGIDFILMQYRGIDNWPGLHYHQYSVSYVAGHFRGSRIEQGISVSRSNQSQCTNNKVHCSVRKWFRSRGGLAVHSCQLSTEVVSVDNEVHDSVSTVDNRVYCAVCERTFSRIGDLKRHKCLAERSQPIKEQQGATQCLVCL